MKKDERAYLLDMIESIELIEKFMNKVKLNQFKKDMMLNNAVIRQLEIIGEAAKNISAKTRKANLDVPWVEICGTRDKLIHAYSGVDLNIVYTIATKQLPELKIKIKRILKDKNN